MYRISISVKDFFFFDHRKRVVEVGSRKNSAINECFLL